MPQPAGGADFGRLIVAVAEARDREAFARLFGHFAPRLKAFLMRAGADAAAAEDFAQEAMLIVWHKASLYDPARAAPSSWIFTIARNLRIDTLRRNRYAPRDIDPSDLPDAPLQPDAAFDGSEGARRVRAALAALPEEQRKVLLLSYFSDLAHGEISRRLDMPLGTVKSRLRLAVARLRETLGDLS
ncbi:sigma-70 family RNA polymerase sigma factor [Terrihabitans soli]|nr:sigma-70 family RNA polymerase sigma factor [Terrihabitans soli]